MEIALYKSIRDQIGHLIVVITKTPLRISLTLSVVLSFSLALITTNWNYLSTTILPNTTIGLYDRNFWENLLVEAHGFLFDVMIIGVFVASLESRRSNRELILRHREDIDDLAHLDTPEINMKKIGIVKRLNAVNILDINVQNLALTEVKAKGIMFKGAKLIGFKLPNGSAHSFMFQDSNLRSSDFSGSTMKNCNFIKCNLYKTDFSRSKVSGTNFTDSNLDRAKFVEADISSVIFKNSDLRGVSFDGANARGANFKGVTNLNIEDLIRAACLDYIVIDETLRNELLERRAEVKFSSR
jgi:uncharacterized protein YjbI with pentapeptide repeats